MGIKINYSFSFSFLSKDGDVFGVSVPLCLSSDRTSGRTVWLFCPSLSILGQDVGEDSLAFLPLFVYPRTESRGGQFGFSAPLCLSSDRKSGRAVWLFCPSLSILGQKVGEG